MTDRLGRWAIGIIATCIALVILAGGLVGIVSSHRAGRAAGARADVPGAVDPERLPAVGELWPAALRRLPARLPDGRAYLFRAVLPGTRVVVSAEVDYRSTHMLVWDVDRGSLVTVRALVTPSDARRYWTPAVTAANDRYFAWWAEGEWLAGGLFREIWAAPVDGGSAALVARFAVLPDELGLTLAVVDDDVVWARETGGIFRAPAAGGGTVRALPGTAGYRLTEWPWMGRPAERWDDPVHHELVNLDTGERRPASPAPSETGLYCSPSWCVNNTAAIVVRGRDDDTGVTVPLAHTGGVLIRRDRVLETTIITEHRYFTVYYDLPTGRLARGGDGVLRRRADGAFSISGLTSSAPAGGHWSTWPDPDRAGGIVVFDLNAID